MDGPWLSVPSSFIYFSISRPWKLLETVCIRRIDVTINFWNNFASKKEGEEVKDDVERRRKGGEGEKCERKEREEDEIEEEKEKKNRRPVATFARVDRSTLVQMVKSDTDLEGNTARWSQRGTRCDVASFVVSTILARTFLPRSCINWVVISQFSRKRGGRMVGRLSYCGQTTFRALATVVKKKDRCRRRGKMGEKVRWWRREEGEEEVPSSTSIVLRGLRTTEPHEATTVRL